MSSDGTAVFVEGTPAKKELVTYTYDPKTNLFRTFDSEMQPYNQFRYDPKTQVLIPVNEAGRPFNTLDGAPDPKEFLHRRELSKEYKNAFFPSAR